MKIFRYKITVNNTERILSIGSIKNKEHTGISCMGMKQVKPLVFAYCILDIHDTGKFDIVKENQILEGRLKRNSIINYLCLDVELWLYNSIMHEGLSKAVAAKIIKDVISKFADVKGKQIGMTKWEISKTT